MHGGTPSGVLSSLHSAGQRLARWRERFPLSWGVLARRYGLSSPLPLPASLGAHALHLLHTALDEEDATFARYHAALRADAESGVPRGQTGRVVSSSSSSAQTRPSLPPSSVLIFSR